jgi:hypothetical protein
MVTASEWPTNNPVPLRTAYGAENDRIRLILRPDFPKAGGASREAVSEL